MSMGLLFLFASGPSALSSDVVPALPGPAAIAVINKTAPRFLGLPSAVSGDRNESVALL